MWRLIWLSLGFVLCIATGKAQSCTDLVGTWQNELGSHLVITGITADHRLEGEYRSASGVDGATFSLVGWINRPTTSDQALAIAFSVRWEGYGSITSWTGSCDVDENGPRISTLWHLVRPETTHPWERIITNNSTFRPVKE
ncbi:MAG: avidin/streptavidin family protein [Saprospiraceae bacterium]|nr:avidin/streptavidin family protein [Saprospiraceae bacterium]